MGLELRAMLESQSFLGATLPGAVGLMEAVLCGFFSKFLVGLLS